MINISDPNSVAAALQKIFRKLYLVRSFEDVPYDLKVSTILKTLFSPVALAALRPDEQHLLIKIHQASGLYVPGLGTDDPNLMQRAALGMSTAQKVFLYVLKTISDNRGSFSGQSPNSEAVYHCLKHRALILLTWALRSCGIADHPYYAPLNLNVLDVEENLLANYHRLATSHPQYVATLKNWIDHFDTINLLLQYELSGSELPREIYMTLSPESIIFLEFLEYVILRALGRGVRDNVRDRKRRLAMGQMIFLLLEKEILDDPENPPYGLTHEQALSQLFSNYESLGKCDRYFLMCRRQAFDAYNVVFSSPTPEIFVRNFAALSCEDQIFLRMLSLIKLFYDLHGHLDPREDYWYSPAYYDVEGLEEDDDEDYNTEKLEQRCYEAGQHEEKTGDTETKLKFDPDKTNSNFALTKEEQEQAAAEARAAARVPKEKPAPESAEDNEAAAGAATAQKRARDDARELENGYPAQLEGHSPQYQQAFLQTLKIISTLGLIASPRDLKRRFNIEDLWWIMTSRDNLDALADDDYRFMFERGLKTAVYLSVFHLPPEKRYIVTDALDDTDRGFIAALVRLEDNSLPRSVRSPAEKVQDKAAEAAKTGKAQAETAVKPAAASPQTAPADAGLKNAAAQSAVPEEKGSAASPEDAGYKAALACIRGICRGLKLCYEQDGVEYSTCRDLQDFFNTLYTVENFVLLAHEDQYFLVQRKRRSEEFLLLSQHAEPERTRELSALGSDDRAFATYVLSLKFKGGAPAGRHGV